MNKGFFTVSDGYHGYTENSTFADTIVTHQKNKISGFILCMHVALLKDPWKFPSELNKLLLR